MSERDTGAMIAGVGVEFGISFDAPAKWLIISICGCSGATSLPRSVTRDCVEFRLRPSTSTLSPVILNVPHRLRHPMAIISAAFSVHHDFQQNELILYSNSMLQYSITRQQLALSF